MILPHALPNINAVLLLLYNAVSAAQFSSKVLRCAYVLHLYLQVMKAAPPWQQQCSSSRLPLCK
jgi:hypothetical protein